METHLERREQRLGLLYRVFDVASNAYAISDVYPTILPRSRHSDRLDDDVDPM